MKIETRHRHEAIRIGREARRLFFADNPGAKLSAKSAGYIREQMEMALADAEEKGSRGFIGPAPAQPSASEGERVEQRLGNAKVVALESENSKRRFATIAGRTFELDASRFDEGATVEFSARLVPTKDDEHDYLSTACFHGKHKRCRKECKFCRSSCQCSCHATKGGADHE